MTVLLIDGDLFAHRYCWAFARKWDWGDMEFHSADLFVARQVLDNRILEWSELFSASMVKVAFSCPPAACFRRLAYPPYKKDRDTAQRPPGLLQMKQYLAETYRGETWDGIEADDLLGIWATKESLFLRKGKYRPRVVVSYDKDLLQVPGTHYDPLKNKVREVSLEEADRFHLFQTLTGDSTDGYPGCKGIGPKKANEILDRECSWDAVVHAFKVAGFTEDYALVQAQCARILRKGDYRKGVGVRVWKPTLHHTSFPSQAGKLRSASDRKTRTIRQ